MRLFIVLFAFLLASGSAQRISNETYQDIPIVLQSELILRDFVLNALEEPNDPFVSAIWDEVSGTVFLWTNGPFFTPQLYSVKYRDLLTTGNQTAFQTSDFTASGSEISVAAAAYSSANDMLLLAGSRTIFRVSGASNNISSSITSSFVFPELVLPFTAYTTGPMMWLPQFRGNNDQPPKLIGVDWTKYAAGPAETTSLPLDDEQMTRSFAHSTGTVFLGGRNGVVQVRDGNTATQDLLTKFTFSDAIVSAFAYDEVRDRLFVCLDIANGVKIARVDVSLGWDSVDGMVFDVLDTEADPFLIVESLLTTGSCEDIALETETGTGFVAMADSTGIGFLAKINLKTLDAVITYIPIQRENSRLVSLHFEQSTKRQSEWFLWGVSTYGIAVWNFTTACSLDCRVTEDRGICVDGFCECTGNWWGLSCTAIACDPPCGDYSDPFRGECINGQCICQPKWTGVGCLEPRCPNDCQGNGNCNETDWTCDCKEVRGGEDCSEVKYTYCEEINSVDFNHTSRKDACLDLHSFLGCGYCGGSYDTCLDGNRAGPVFDSCMWWFYDGWWNPAFLVFIVVMMFSWLVMFFLNGYSMLVEDLKFAKLRSENPNPHYYGTKGYQKKLWWRDERSHKSWKMFDQMQFLAAYGVINALFTTKLYNFLAFWNWSLFVIPFATYDHDSPFYGKGYFPMRAFNWTPINFPFPPVPPAVWDGSAINRTKRIVELEADYAATDASMKRDYEQFVNSAETMPDHIYPTAVLWFLIAFFGFLFLYACYYVVVVTFIYNDDVYKTILGYRFKHIIARVLHAFYFPAVFLAVFAIQVEPDGFIALAVLFGIIFIGLGLPGFFMLLTQQPLLTEWFDPALRIPYGSFFAPFQKKRIKFQLFTYLRKFAAGCSLGAMARGFDPEDEALFWAQMIVTLAIFVIYLVVLIWKRPYIDMIHLVVDGALTLLNAITILLSLLAIQSDAGTQDALQWIVLVVQIPCMFLVVVAYCWSSMFYAGYTSPKQFFCCEGKPVQEGDDKLIETGGGAGPSSAAEPEDKGPEDFSSDEALNNMDLPSSE